MLKISVHFFHTTTAASWPPLMADLEAEQKVIHAALLVARIEVVTEEAASFRMPAAHGLLLRAARAKVADLEADQKVIHAALLVARIEVVTEEAASFRKRACSALADRDRAVADRVSG